MFGWARVLAAAVVAASLGLAPAASGDICNGRPACFGRGSLVHPLLAGAPSQAPDRPPLRITDGGFPEKGPGPVVEGAPCAFEIKRGTPRDVVTTVRYSTRSGTATEGVDFDAVAAKATFSKGDQIWFLSVDTFQDADPEDTERFSVVLRDATNGRIVDRAGTCTVFDAG